VTSPAFRAAERARKNFRPVSDRQRKELARLSGKAGIERPEPRTKAQASDALDRLQQFLTQPQLENFTASTSKPETSKAGAV
jgi:hypothetical protein